MFGNGDRPETYPDPVEHCRVCDWWSECTDRRRDDDHLCRVAGISRLQTKRLVDASVPTLTALATVPTGERKQDLAPRTLHKLREQARLQQEQYRDGQVRYELIQPDPEEPGQGLAALPEPSPGDLFLDFESDPWALEGGLEFLSGRSSRRTARPSTPRGGPTRARRRSGRSRSSIDTIVARREAHPGMHVYHYGGYEAGAIKRLMGRYATREDEVDQLLRGGVLVDLFSIVRQGVRVSQESYSLKKVEKLYMPEREGPKTRPGFALVEYEKWMESRDPHDPRRPRGLQPGRLRLDPGRCGRGSRACARRRRRRSGSRSAVRSPRRPSRARTLAAQIEETRRRVEALTKDVPADVAQRTKEQQARWILAQLLDWHRREAKPQWWLHFSLLKAPVEDLVASSDALGELPVRPARWGPSTSRSSTATATTPSRSTSSTRGTRPYDPATGKSAGTVRAVDPAAGTIDLKRGKRNDAPHPAALIPRPPLRTNVLRDALRRVADAVLRRRDRRRRALPGRPRPAPRPAAEAPGHGTRRPAGEARREAGGRRRAGWPSPSTTAASPSRARPARARPTWARA